jgi:hypothetical protein
MQPEEEEERVEVVVKRQEATKVDQQPPEASDRNKTTTTGKYTNASFYANQMWSQGKYLPFLGVVVVAIDNVVADMVMVKRRSVFQGSTTTTQEVVAIDKASITAANRRSGEFSSTFKNRLSTFELTEAAAAKADTVASRVTPDRDPHFKNKLATFHKVGETTASTSHVLPPSTTDADENNKPDFKAKLAAFRQVEEKASAKLTPAPPPPPAAAKFNKPMIPANKPVIPVAVKPPPSILRTTTPATAAAVPQKAVESIQNPEPIYANSSVAMAGSSSSGHQRVVVTVDAQSSSYSGPPVGVGDAESYSDCTEDEGIRSLSPHGTPSPTSPTPNGDGYRNCFRISAGQRHRYRQHHHLFNQVII